MTATEPNLRYALCSKCGKPFTAFECGISDTEGEVHHGRCDELYPVVMRPVSIKVMIKALFLWKSARRECVASPDAAHFQALAEAEQGLLIAADLARDAGLTEDKR